MHSQYELPFNFYLWSNIPSTCKYKWWRHYKENVLKVSYIITVKVISKEFDIENLELKKEFCVNNMIAVHEGLFSYEKSQKNNDIFSSEKSQKNNDILTKNDSYRNSMNFMHLRDSEMLLDEKAESVITINKCVCLQAGLMSFTISVNRRAFIYDESIKCTVSIDNTKSQKNVKGIKLSLLKKLKICTEDKYYKKNITQRVDKVVKDYGLFGLNVKANSKSEKTYDLKIFHVDMQKEDVTCYGQLFCNRFYLKCELDVEGIQQDNADFAQTEIILINRDKTPRIRHNETFAHSNEPWTPVTNEPMTALLQGDALKFDSLHSGSQNLDIKTDFYSNQYHSSEYLISINRTPNPNSMLRTPNSMLRTPNQHSLVKDDAIIKEEHEKNKAILNINPRFKTKKD